MRARTLLIAATVTLAAPSTASAAGGVYGGTTAAGEAIVLNSDRAGKRLRSVVLAWTATCDDGATYPVALRATPTAGSPGLVPGPDDLVMRRNARRRFTGVAAMVHDLGEPAGLVTARLTGRLRRTSASGTLAAHAEVVDAAGGDTITTCRTGTVRWRATRAPGRVFGGSTSGDEPVVVRLDARRRSVQDVYLGWTTRPCQPGGGMLRFADHFGDFAVDRRGRWGASFEQQLRLDSGGRASFAYALGATLRGPTLRGTLAVEVERFDAAGVMDVACDTGRIAWKATTG